MGDLNISRGNPSLTDSVRLELLLICDPHKQVDTRVQMSRATSASLNQ